LKTEFLPTQNIVPSKISIKSQMKTNRSNEKVATTWQQKIGEQCVVDSLPKKEFVQIQTFLLVGRARDGAWLITPRQICPTGRRERRLPALHDALPAVSLRNQSAN